MFHRSGFASRVSLPPVLFGKLLEAHRSNARKFSVLFADQLAPWHCCADGPEFGGDTINTPGARLMTHCPPAQIDFPVRTMEPDLADRHAFPAETIRLQWLPLLATVPTWSEVSTTQISATERNTMYAEMTGFDHVVCTNDTTPYGNLGLVVDPSRSKTLASVPPQIPVPLAVALSQAGHSIRVAVLPAEMSDATPLPGQKVFEAECHVREMVSAISESWLPDVHVQDPTSALQTPLAFRTGIPEVRQQLCASLGSAWQSCPNATLDDTAFHSVVSHRKTIIVRCLRSTAAGPSVILVNGVSCGF